MASYTFTNKVNSFTLHRDDTTSESKSTKWYFRNRFTPQEVDGNANILEIIDEEGIDGFKMTIGTDTIDVDGTTSWANATVLAEALAPLFFLASPGASKVPSGDVEITTDYTITQANAGYRYDVNAATTADLTVNSDSLLDGQFVEFTWIGVTQPVFVAGTATIKLDLYDSQKCRSKEATFGIRKRGSVYEVYGKVE